MTTIGITIQGPDGRPERVSQVSGSRVRIGRSEKNDVVLKDALVSEWHGVLSTEEGRLAYVDLGSTNGSKVDGSVVGPNAPIPLSRGSWLQIGSKSLQFRVSKDTALPEPSGGTPATRVSSEEAKTTLFAEAVAASRVPAAVNDAPVAMTKVEPHFEVVLVASAQIAPLLVELERARGKVVHQLQRDLSRVDRTELETVAARLAQIHPELAAGSVVAEFLESQTPDVKTHAARNTSAKDAPTAKPGTTPSHPEQAGPASSSQPEQSAERAALQTFAEAFLELRRCREHLCGDLGISVSKNNVFERCDSPAELVSQLIDLEQQHQPQRALAEAFASQAAHQIGILSGVVAGARALLGRLSPSAIASQVRGSHPLGAPEDPNLRKWDLLVPFRPAAFWQRFSESHFDMTHEDRFVRELFGAAFAHAYQSVVSGSQSAPQ